MEEKIEISILLSLYGKMLTDTQKRYMELYYNKDFSLSEIGDSEKITRQAVSKILLKAKNKLQEYEINFGFMKKEKIIKDVLEKLENTNLTKEQKKLIENINLVLDF